MTDLPPENPDAGNEPAEARRSRPLSDEEKYYYEQSYKDPVDRIGRIEDTAKFLIGAAATTSGLFVAAVKLVRDNTVAESDLLWLLPFIAWAISITCLVLVLFPQRYPAGRAQPAAWREAFLAAGRKKYRYLGLGAFAFVLGILLAVLPLSR